MREAVIVDAVRSPMGRARKGSLIEVRPDDLCATVVRGLLDRNPGVDPAEIEDVIVGCAIPEAEQGLNVARNISFLARIPNSAAATTVNRYCGSSLQTIDMAAQAIMTGNGDVFLAAGVESMTRVPMPGFNTSPNPKLLDTYPEAYTPMGITAENVAERYGIKRDEQDQFALASHQKAVAASDEGRFAQEIIAIPLDGSASFSVDEGPRRDTSLEKLATLEPSFRTDGTVTAGNSSPLTDGAAAVLVMSAERAQQLGLKPMAIVRHMAVAGVDPEVMGLGPIPAVTKALARGHMSIDDIDLLELNEAFAAQSLAVIRDLEIDTAKLNVNGGAIALGHPLGCSGARITTTLLHEMGRRGSKFGLATMCIGGGQGIATIFERA
jgi:acetyl-CoA acetyltransferase family protein